MKTTATLVCFVFAAAMGIADATQAQEFRVGPFGIRIGNHDHHNHDHGGPGYRPSNHRPSVVGPGQSRRPYRPTYPNVRPNPYENPIYVQPKQVEKLVYNPYSGRWEVKVSSEVIHESATDPNRDVVDRGSYRVRSSYSTDRFGRTIETRVESWTSYGVPHSNTKTRVISNNGNVQIEEEQNVLRSPNPFSRD